jgi:hypothetical protein
MGANGTWAGADGLGQVLTGTGMVSTLGWSATQEVGGCSSINDAGSEQCSWGWLAVYGGLTEEVRKVRIPLAFLPLIGIMVSIRRNIHYIREG